jgi:RNA polymerase sigma-70 factor, ECF subfamily
MAEKNGSDLTDEQLIALIVRGETSLFRTIVERYQRRVLAVGLRFYRNEDDARDFAQEVFMKAYGALGTFRGGARFYSWLIRIAFNQGISATRAAREAGELPTELPGGGPTPEAAHLRKEVRESLGRAMAGLPEKYRVCVDLSFFFGLSYAEISDITGFPVNTVKSHVLRARLMLRDALRGTAAEDYHEV